MTYLKNFFFLYPMDAQRLARLIWILVVTFYTIEILSQILAAYVWFQMKPEVFAKTYSSPLSAVFMLSISSGSHAFRLVIELLGIRLALEACKRLFSVTQN